MGQVRCYIGLGSNQGDSPATLHSALALLAQQAGITLVQVSRFYHSKPVGPQDQPDYVNAVACLDTNLDAHRLLATLLKVEQAHGRVRDPALRWGPRTLDLDLLLYGHEQINTANLIVPHPQMHLRAFVIHPLFEIAPELLLPNGQSVRHYQQQLDGSDLYPL